MAQKLKVYVSGSLLSTDVAVLIRIRTTVRHSCISIKTFNPQSFVMLCNLCFLLACYKVEDLYDYVLWSLLDSISLYLLQCATETIEVKS